MNAVAAGAHRSGHRAERQPVVQVWESGKPGYFYDYNFTVEQSFNANTLLRASFHANYGIKLQQSQNLNQLDPRYIGDLRELS